MKEERMLYRRYKQSFSDCETLGDYDKVLKTITVLIPDGRMKPSGVRGQHFGGYHLWAKGPDGKAVYMVYRAVSEENAMKQHRKACREMGFTPCDPPDGKPPRIYL